MVLRRILRGIVGGVPQTKELDEESDKGSEDAMEARLSALTLKDTSFEEPWIAVEAEGEQHLYQQYQQWRLELWQGSHCHLLLCYWVCEQHQRRQHICPKCQW